MKKYLLLVLLSIAIYKVSHTQETPGVEKQIYGVQAGILGAWAHGEFKAAELVSVRVEAGYNFGFGIYGTNFSYWAIPALSVEPRYYYTFNKRNEKGKNTENNSGSYLSLNSSYHSARGVITNSTSAYNPALTFIPQIGFRQCKKHFSFEIAGGVGYGYALQSTVNNSGVVWGFTLRMGYNF